MKKLEHFITVIIYVLTIVALIYFFGHPMIKNKSHSLNLIDLVKINFSLLTQEREIDVYDGEPVKFYTLLEVDDVKNREREVQEIMEDFKEKYTEQSCAVLVLYEQDGVYESARFLTVFRTPLSIQTNDAEIAYMKEKILNYFNNGEAQKGMQYFKGVMRYFAQTGLWIDHDKVADYYGNVENGGYDASLDDYVTYDEYTEYDDYETQQSGLGQDGTMDADDSQYSNMYDERESIANYVRSQNYPNLGYDNGYYSGYLRGKEDAERNMDTRNFDYTQSERFQNEDKDLGFYEGYDQGYYEGYYGKEGEYSYDVLDDRYGQYLEDYEAYLESGIDSDFTDDYMIDFDAYTNDYDSFLNDYDYTNESVYGFDYDDTNGYNDIYDFSNDYNYTNDYDFTNDYDYTNDYDFSNDYDYTNDYDYGYDYDVYDYDAYDYGY